MRGDVSRGQRAEALYRPCGCIIPPKGPAPSHDSGRFQGILLTVGSSLSLDFSPVLAHAGRSAARVARKRRAARRLVIGKINSPGAAPWATHWERQARRAPPP